MNISNNHQITSKLKGLRVAALCIAASLLVGFAKPELSQESVSETTGMSLAEWVARPLSHHPEVRSMYKPMDIASMRPRIHVISPELAQRASRPSSFAHESAISSVLDQVNSRHWLESAKYSPDLARAELIGNLPVTFHGVGFPDIRTDRKPKHFFSAVDADPSQWNQLVTWRNSKTSGGASEPIPHVRCMGLSPQAVARRADKYEHLISELSERYKVNSNLVKAVVTEESCFDNLALSHVGAQGLMQLMPATAVWLKVTDPGDPKDNLRGGVRYLSSLLKEFETVELALAAYNAGPGNVRRYNGVPPFAETRAYLQKVKSNYRRYSAATRLADDGHNS
jgi:soluble lytic murein transglycosylase-like protein